MNDDQAEDLKLLVRRLPSLLKNLQVARLVGSEQHNVSEEPVLSANPQSCDIPKKALTHGIDSDANLRASARGTDKEAIPGWLDAIPEITNNSKQDLRVKEDGEAREGEQVQLMNGTLGKENESPEKDEDTRYSFFYFCSACLIHLRSSRLSAAENSHLYEGWLLENRKHTPGPTIVKFCGLKIRIYPGPNTHGNEYLLKPKSLDQNFLKLHVHKSDTNSTDPRVTFLESLDDEAQDAIKELIEDRNDNAFEGYSWIIAAIVDVGRRNSDAAKRASFWRKKRDPLQQSPRWMIVLKGGLHEPAPKIATLPDRWSSPWAPRNDDIDTELAKKDTTVHPDVNVKDEAIKSGAETSTGPRAEAQPKTINPGAIDKKKPIRFKDCVGRRFTFPFELARTWLVSPPKSALLPQTNKSRESRS